MDDLMWYKKDFLADSLNYFLLVIIMLFIFWGEKIEVWTKDLVTGTLSNQLIIALV